MFRVDLTPGRQGPRIAFLRDPSGRDELALSQETIAASELVARLLVPDVGSTGRGVVAGPLTLSDRDRLVAALHGRCFGQDLTSAVTCGACDGAFELSFLLSDMLGDVDRRSAAAVKALAVEGPDAGGGYRLDDGTRFRLPTVDDERAILGLSAEQSVADLLARCLLSEGPPPASGAVEAAMEALGPVLTLDVPVDCAECGAAQEVEFDMVRFFLAALGRERPILMREIHWIARAYHWSCDEIVGLSRPDRRAMVSLILADHDRRRTEA